MKGNHQTVKRYIKTWSHWTLFLSACFSLLTSHFSLADTDTQPASEPTATQPTTETAIAEPIHPATQSAAAPTPTEAAHVVTTEPSTIPATNPTTMPTTAPTTRMATTRPSTRPAGQPNILLICTDDQAFGHCG